MEKCQRCSKNPITLQCFNCPLINRICSLCDKIIHNTTLKIDHVRVPIENVTLNLKDNQEFENKEEPNNNKMIFIEQNLQEESKEQENLDFNKKIKNCSTIVKNNNNSEILDNLGIDVNNMANTNDLSTLNQSKNMDDKTIENNSQKYRNTKFYLLKNRDKTPKGNQQIYFTNDNNLYNNNNNRFLEENKENILNSVFNKKLLIADKYSKEYINEIKKIFKKEKEQLEYKNKILENSITKLKIEFNEHVAYLTKELESNQSNNDLNLKLITENYKNKINEMKKNNEIEISSLKEEIFNTQNDKNELNNSFMGEITQKNQIIQKLQQENEELKNELNIKNNEIENLHKSFNELTLQYETKFEENKNELVKDFQEKMTQIIEKFESSKNDLIESIDNRESEIKDILEIKNNEINKLNLEIQNLKDELNCHKINLIKIRDDRNYLLKENEVIKKKIFQNVCNEKIQINEIDNLKKENEDLYQQIDKLKIELSKLDVMIYGKPRTKF